jgi:hypothetical protein
VISWKFCWNREPNNALNLQHFGRNALEKFLEKNTFGRIK